jgi:hypothetical protein
VAVLDVGRRLELSLRGRLAAELSRPESVASRQVARRSKRPLGAGAWPTLISPRPEDGGRPEVSVPEDASRLQKTDALREYEVCHSRAQIGFVSLTGPPIQGAWGKSREKEAASPALASFDLRLSGAASARTNGWSKRAKIFRPIPGSNR